jgi:hypothetical protein
LIGLQSFRIRASIGFEKVRRGNLAPVAAFVCLAALLVQFFLPILHTYSHLLEDAAILLDTGATSFPSRDRNDAPTFGLICEAEAASRHSHHDPSTCPICQTLLHASAYVVSSHLAALSAHETVGFLPAGRSDEKPSPRYLTGCSPRAPPVTR